ncbi:LOW QUALITY PROTEIN: hypothetical protein Cgig2_002885 [Carnegiea gigantea]|uniref:Uncharacterized protein n=1 Tax=Carnegiea gigantea TaxID=171969 RepID=A0A9Q1KNN7_9CARY|nr:LOW QUALITY PROTEIN: hypothetical protein Cgig2_002885 [Carnegiea gigantea]
MPGSMMNPTQSPPFKPYPPLSVTRARNLPPEEITPYTLVGDARGRVAPPRSSNHFGNICFLAQGVATVGELNELGWASMLLHKAVLAQDDKAIHGLLKDFIEAPFVKRSILDPFLGPKLFCSVIHHVAVRSGYFDKKDGKVMAYPGCAGGYSVDLEMCLSPQTMKALESDQESMHASIHAFLPPVHVERTGPDRPIQPVQRGTGRSTGQKTMQNHFAGQTEKNRSNSVDPVNLVQSGQVQVISESFVKPKNEVEASDSNQQSSLSFLGSNGFVPLILRLHATRHAFQILHYSTFCF